ncbi:MAG TPA: MBOAT family protein [Nitriliruptorales bacterium]|nr:MBOAT family protein [Nitriliruptorales bacterium]
MLFPTVEFAVFFVVVLVGGWLLMHQLTAWKLFVLAASYVFYAAWDWRYTALLAGSTILNQLTVLTIGRQPTERRRRLALAAGIGANLGVLGWFKYYGFFVTSARNALGEFGITPPLPLLEIVLPVGISFFTFQAMSYVIDVYRDEIDAAPWLDVFVYLSFFPQLVAGPIVRGSEFLPQLRAPRDPTAIPAVHAFGLILAGLFKKVVIANALAVAIVDDVFADPGTHTALEVLAGVYGYAVQIYADFAGYTDIAIGVALLLGFRFPQNFDAPYAALSLRDFWRRWHMTLSRWLRDYLYIPLGGSRGGAASTFAALITTMVLGGLWHGAAWTFVLWGLLHGLGLAAERALGQGVVSAEGMRPLEATVRRVITFHLVCLGWIFFRAESVGDALHILARLTATGPVDAVTPAVLLLIAIGIGFQYVPKRVGARLELAAGRMRPAAVGAMLGVGLLVVDGFGPEGIAPFIYFQF